MRSSLRLLLPLQVCLLLLLSYTIQTCSANPLSSQSSVLDHQNVKQLLQTPGFHLDLPTTIANSLVEKPQTFHTLSKRRVPSRPPGTIPFSAQPSSTYVFRFYKFTYVISSDHLTSQKTRLNIWMQNFFCEFLAASLLGIELQPRRRILLRAGQLTLNLQSVVGVLSQEIVTAVVKRLGRMATEGLTAFFPAGEVVQVGAGVRVLFAVGVELRGAVELGL